LKLTRGRRKKWSRFTRVRILLHYNNYKIFQEYQKISDSIHSAIAGPNGRVVWGEGFDRFDNEIVVSNPA
jgi:hypothetical protein